MAGHGLTFRLLREPAFAGMTIKKLPLASSLAYLIGESRIASGKLGSPVKPSNDEVKYKPSNDCNKPLNQNIQKSR